MIAIRKARPADAVAIAAVHVAAWRNTYPGILPDAFLAKLSVSRQAVYYDQAIRSGTGVLVAIASGVDVAPGSAARIIGFTTAGRARRSEISGQMLGEGEVVDLAERKSVARERHRQRANIVGLADVDRGILRRRRRTGVLIGQAGGRGRGSAGKGIARA